MACTLDYSFRRQFQSTLRLKWFSTTQYDAAMTDAHIPNAIDGYIGGDTPEMEHLGQATTSIGSHDLQASPYPTWLRPLVDPSPLYQAKSVFLDNVEFLCFDTLIDGGGYGQDAATVTSIIGSRNSNRTLGQALYQNGMPVNWQPNYFCPEFVINGLNIFSEYQTNGFKKLNLGDKSIGDPLPRCYDFQKMFLNIKNIEVYAQVAQYIPATQKYQRYPVMCMATFLLSEQVVEI